MDDHDELDITWRQARAPARADILERAGPEASLSLTPIVQNGQFVRENTATAYAIVHERHACRRQAADASGCAARHAACSRRSSAGYTMNRRNGSMAARYGRVIHETGRT